MKKAFCVIASICGHVGFWVAMFHGKTEMGGILLCFGLIWKHKFDLYELEDKV